MRLLTVIFGCLTVAATCLAQAPDWTHIKPSTSPSALATHEMAYDSARQRTVLFGGGSGDTWEYDGGNWTKRKLIPSPPDRSSFAMVYDSVRRRTVLFGGLGRSGYLGDTWEFDGKSWTQMKLTRSPGARIGHAMAYDSTRQRTVLFGGVPGSSWADDTWEWDGSVWTQIKPSTSPSGRAYSAMVCDSARQRVVLFGGFNNFSGGGILGDTWEFDGNNWLLMKPANSPPARDEFAMAYDAARQRTVLFGGFDRSFSILGDTWEWGGGNWVQSKPTASPPRRVYSAMVYDSVRQRTVLFAGQAAGLFADTWEYGIPKLTLTASTPTISIASGGTQVFTLNAGADLKNKSYWLFGSMSGTMPGVVLTGVHIPLRVDPYTDLVIGSANAKEFKDFRRTLTATGAATASLNVPAKLPIPAGFKLYHSYIVYNGTTGQVFTSSNPVSVEFK